MDSWRGGNLEPIKPGWKGFCEAVSGMPGALARVVAIQPIAGQTEGLLATVPDASTVAAPLVLSIQSQVISGHVGNAPAAFALQRLGFEVLALPTVLLTHHPGHGSPAGRALASTELAAHLDCLQGRGLLGNVAGLLTGYLGEPGNGAIALDAWKMLKAANPRALFLCDPVIGDRDGGIYVRPGLPEFFRDQAVAAANILTPNHFELEWLAGTPVLSIDQALAAGERLLARGPRLVVCTSLITHDTPQDSIETLAVAGDGAWLVRTPRLAQPPHGSGDLFAALLFAHLLQGVSPPAALARSVTAVYSVLKESDGAPEMRLIECQAVLARPPVAFTARRLR